MSNSETRVEDNGREFTCEWKHTPPLAESYSEVRRGSVKVKAHDLSAAIAQAKIAVFREHGITAAQVEILTIGEDFL